jgi:ABC-type sugar transport system, permease component
LQKKKWNSERGVTSIIKRTSKYTTYIFIAFLGLTFLFPLVWMLGISFKETSEVYSNPFGLPKHWYFLNYAEALKTASLPQYVLNNVIYAVGTLALTLVCGTMLAYCLSRLKWVFSKAVLTYISAGLIIPLPVVILSMFIQLKALHIMNTYIGLILPYSAFALASCVLMLYAFFRTLPMTLEESAFMDGGSIFTAFFKIILPLSKPALSTQVVFIFMNVWNDYFMGFMLTSKDAMRPLAVGLANLIATLDTTNWGLVGAGSVLASAPIVIVYLVFSEQIEKH